MNGGRVSRVRATVNTGLDEQETGEQEEEEEENNEERQMMTKGEVGEDYDGEEAAREEGE